MSRPTKLSNETNIEYFARIKKSQDVNADKHLTNSTAKNQSKIKYKFCIKCGYQNGAGGKQCKGTTNNGKTICNNTLPQSTNPQAIASRERRKRRKIEQQSKLHNQCSICQRKLSIGETLAISLCTPVPCGRSSHLKCLKKHVQNNSKRHHTFGRIPVKCVYCNRVLKDPYYIEIFGPFSAKSNGTSKRLKVSKTSKSSKKVASSAISTTKGGSKESSSSSSSSSNVSSVGLVVDGQLTLSQHALNQ